MHLLSWAVPRDRRGLEEAGSGCSFASTEPLRSRERFLSTFYRLEGNFEFVGDRQGSSSSAMSGNAAAFAAAPSAGQNFARAEQFTSEGSGKKRATNRSERGGHRYT